MTDSFTYHTECPKCSADIELEFELPEFVSMDIERCDLCGYMLTGLEQSIVHVKANTAYVGMRTDMYHDQLKDRAHGE